MILSSFKMITLASDSPLSSVNAPGEAKLLTSLGIMNDSDTEDYWSNKVTRGEFAMYLYNIAKNEAQFETKSYYTDVLVSSELEKAVSHLVYLRGDGALTGGLAFEGLNNAGATNTDLLVILNDNRRSIDSNVGALRKHLLRITSSHKYNRMKRRVWNGLSLTPRLRRLL